MQADALLSQPPEKLVKNLPANAGDIRDASLIPWLGRSTGEGIGYSLQHSWASPVAQLVKNPPTMWETWVQSLGWEDPLEKGQAKRASLIAQLVKNPPAMQETPV